MSAAPDRPGGQDRSRLAGDDGGAGTAPKPSLVIGRALGTVVVTVDGALTSASCELLDTLLVDLIEGQGNRAVAVDLAKASIEEEALGVLIDAAHRASRRRTRFALSGLPPDAHHALLSGGLSESVEVEVTRRRLRS